jgi:hypothetical protein
MLLYPEYLTEEQVKKLERAYQIRTNLKLIYDFQSDIHPVLHNNGKGNDHADSWRMIEHTKKLIDALIIDLKK